MAVTREFKQPCLQGPGTEKALKQQGHCQFEAKGTEKAGGMKDWI